LEGSRERPFCQKETKKIDQKKPKRLLKKGGGLGSFQRALWVGKALQQTKPHLFAKRKKKKVVARM